MDELQREVASLQALGIQHLDVKDQIAHVVALQAANRQALAAIRSSSGPGPSSSSSSIGGGGGGAEHTWVARPGGLWLQLPREQAVRVLQQESRDLSAQLERLFERQRAVLGELERAGLGPEHFLPA